MTPEMILSGLIISIHAPHARSDYPEAVYRPSQLRISIHAPHARSDRSSRLVVVL